MANAWKLKHRIFDAVGPHPLAIRLVDGDIISDDEFVIFAKRIEPPRIEHVTNTKSQISFSLKWDVVMLIINPYPNLVVIDHARGFNPNEPVLPQTARVNGKTENFPFHRQDPRYEAMSET